MEVITLKGLVRQSFGHVLQEHFNVSILDVAPEEVQLDQVVLGARCDALVDARRKVLFLSSNTQEQMGAVMAGGRLRLSR